MSNNSKCNEPHGVMIDKKFPNEQTNQTVNYDIIYADPPWSWANFNNGLSSRDPEQHYKTMSYDEISKMDINSIASKNSVLFMWITFPRLIESLSIIEAWGFTFKTIAFVWVKRNKNKGTFFMGGGYYTRSNAEICILATKGKPLKRIDKGISQIIYTPIQKHSKKPDEVRVKIEKLFGKLPRIELFARQRINGWDSIGDELKPLVTERRNS